jgi:hypothetical protein
MEKKKKNARQRINISHSNQGDTTLYSLEGDEVVIAGAGEGGDQVDNLARHGGA